MADEKVSDEAPIVTRESAKSRGLTHYFTGQPCARGHVSVRYASTGACKECSRADSAALKERRRADPESRRIDADRRRVSYLQNAEVRRARSRKYKQDNPLSEEDRRRDAQRRKEHRLRNIEHEREVQREWAVKNRDKKKANDLAWYLNNKEKRYAAVARWRSKNTEKINVFTRNYRSKKRGAVGSHTADDVTALYARQDGVCACGCGSDLSDGYEVDHVVPVSRGGSNGPENLQLLTPRCNKSKQDKTMDEWAAWKAGLPLAG